MNSISRHEIFSSEASILNMVESFEKMLQDKIKESVQNPERLFTFAQETHRHIGRLLCLPHPQSFREACRLLSDLYCGYFFSATAYDSAIDLQIAGNTYTCPGNQVRKYFHKSSGLQGLYITLILGQDDLINWLFNPYLLPGGKAEDPITNLEFAVFDLWGSVFKDHDQFSARLANAMDACQIVEESGSGEEVVDLLILPEIRLLLHIVTNEAERTEELMADGLAKHRKFWSAGTRGENEIGWWSPKLTALSVLARKHKNMSIETRSDYILPLK